MAREPIYESEHYAIIPCKDIAAVPIEGEDWQQRLLALWCDFFEDLRRQGYRPIHRMERPQAVVCEKIEPPMVAYDTGAIELSEAG